MNLNIPTTNPRLSTAIRHYPPLSAKLFFKPIVIPVHASPSEQLFFRSPEPRNLSRLAP
jgi:hypothetical protein